MQLTFGQPLVLALLLVILPVLFWSYFNSFALVSRLRSRTMIAIRAAIAVLLVTVLADPRFPLTREVLRVIFLVDLSDSIKEDARGEIAAFLTRAVDAKKDAGRGDDELGLVAFGNDAIVLQPVARTMDVGRFYDPGDKTRTDIGRGLRIATSMFDETAMKKIVLISDGNQNAGDIAAQLGELKRNAVAVDVLPVRHRGAREVLVEALELPAVIRPDQPAPGKIVIKSTGDAAAEMTLYRNDRPVLKSDVELRAGANVFKFSENLSRDQTGGEDLLRYRVSISSADDTEKRNNTAECVARFMIDRDPRVLYVEGNRREYEHLAGVLDAAGMKVDVPTDDFPQIGIEELARYDVLILSDFPAYRLTDYQMKQIEVFVHELGGGLLMLGGKNSFGPGGYYKTPVEKALPVTMDVKRQKRLPAMGMMILIDKSGSMSGEPIKLAREGSIRCVELLADYDYLGVMAFDYEGKWISEYRRLSDKNAVIDEISRLVAGGGTDIEPTLIEAEKVLGASDVMVRHVLAVTDGMVADRNFPDLVKRYREKRITVSTIAIGEYADLEFLKWLSQSTGGECYHATDATSVPRIFSREVEIRNNRATVEEPFVPSLRISSQIFSGVDVRGIGPLLGYVRTTPKPMAEVLLETDTLKKTEETSEPDCLFARWRFGLGKSAVFTSDATRRWSKDWVGSASYAKFFTQIARYLLPDRSGKNILANFAIDRGTGRVSLLYMDDDGNYVNFRKPNVRIVGPSLKTEEYRMHQTDAGYYVCDFPATEPGAYFASFVDGDRPLGHATNVVGYSAEYRETTENMRILKSIVDETGGRFLTPENPADVYRIDVRSKLATREIWHYLLMAALLLLVFEIAVRRLVLDRELLQRVTREVEATQGAVGKLMARKAKTVEKRRAKIAASSSDVKTDNVVARVLGDDAAGQLQEAPVPASPPSETPVPDTDYIARLKMAKGRKNKK